MSPSTRAQAPAATCLVDGPGACFDWDITALVSHWLALDQEPDGDPVVAGIKGNYGLILLAMPGSQAGECRLYSSEYLSEPNVQPAFEITYMIPTSTPSPTPTLTPSPTATATSRAEPYCIAGSAASRLADAPSGDAEPLGADGVGIVDV